MNLISKKKKSRARAIFSIALILILAVPTLTGAQEPSRLMKKADNWLKAYDYTKALNAYTKLLNRGESYYYVTRKIADCYRLLDQPTQAVEWYQKTLAFPDVEKETYYHLAKELEKLKRYEEAEKNIQRYRSLVGKSPRINGLSTEDFLLTIKQDSALWSLYLLNINTSASEFGPTIHNDQLVFTSNQRDRSIINRRDVRNRQPFFDLYASTILDFTSMDKPVPFAPNTWSALNDGPVAFSPDGLRMYVTSNVQNSSKDQQQNLDILVFNLVKGEWSSRPSFLPLRAQEYSIMHPAFSKDGKTLFFASDMPGGYGGLDLYYSQQRKGFLSSPVNLGPTINTPGNEVFPFITKNGDLYFASDGHPGLGGLDIFLAQWDDNEFWPPINAGAFLNSPYDDFSIWFIGDETSGYFASNRPGGKGNDDLYAFSRTRKLEYTRITGVVVDEVTGEPLDQVYITLNTNGLSSGEWITGPDGRFEFYMKTGNYSTLSFMKRLFQPQEKQINPNDIKGHRSLKLEIPMSPR